MDRGRIGDGAGGKGETYLNEATEGSEKSTVKYFRNWPGKENRVSMLARLAGTAITKYHRLEWFKQQIFNSLSSGG